MSDSNELVINPDGITNILARKLQAALVNALYQQIKINPTEVSASTLAVAERMLARWNMGLVEVPEDEEMTEEEKDMVEQFKELGITLDSDLFEEEDE